MLLIVNSCFLLLVRAFDKLQAFKTRKEKRATSPKIKQFMPKISEIALYIEKRTDIFGINPIASIWSKRRELNPRDQLGKLKFYH